MEGSVGGANARYWEDLEVGDRRTTIERTITETDLVNFVGMTYWIEPYFTSVPHVLNSHFKQRIVPGPLITSISMGQHLLMNWPSERVALMGIDAVRWLKPVAVGDTIRTESEIAAKREHRSLDRGILTVKHTVRNQRDEVVSEYESLRMVYRRPAGETGAPGSSG